MFIKMSVQKLYNIRWLFLMLGALMVLTACTGIVQPALEPNGQAGPDDIPEISIEVSESGISVPEVVPGGIVGISIHNTGSLPHSTDLWRIKPGHTSEEIIALHKYIKENPDDFFGVFEIGSWIHLVEDIQPGETYHFYAELGVGDFFMSDETNPDADLVFFGATEQVGVTEPTADVVVDMVDFAYVMPDTITSGKQLWEVTNTGEQWHLAAFISTNPDASPEDILASFGDENGPPPTDAAVEVLGGMPPMSPGERVWLEFDLEPGSYEVACPLPDVSAFATGEEPLPHLMHGMRHAFTVAD